VFVCWAKVGKAKLIANPTRATATVVFIMLRLCRFRLITDAFVGSIPTDFVTVYGFTGRTPVAW